MSHGCEVTHELRVARTDDTGAVTDQSELAANGDTRDTASTNQSELETQTQVSARCEQGHGQDRAAAVSSVRGGVT